MIKYCTLKALQAAMNQALALDEESLPKIQALKGKVVQINVRPLNASFFLCFSEQGLVLQETYQETVDTVIESSPLGFIRLSLLPISKVRSLFNDQVKLSGDVELGQAVKRLFDELDIDWEGHLAQFTGDVVAHQMGSIFRKGQDFTKQAAASVHKSFSEYLHEEIRLFVSQEELNDFYQEVDELSLAVERVEASIHLLMSQDETN